MINIVPEVGDPGKTTVYVRRFDAERDTVVKGQDPQPYVAISTRCTHVGCPVRYIQASQKFVCPCHGGVYGFEGQVEGGPPVRPLDRFYTRVEGGRVRDRRPLLASTRNSSASRRATRRTTSTGSGSTSTRRGRPYEAPRSPASQAAAPAPKRPGQDRNGGNGNGRNGGPATKPTAKDHAVEGAATAIGWLDERTGRQPVPARLPLPQGPQGHQLVLHAGLGHDVRLPLAGRHRRVPGHVLRARPDRAPTTSASRITNEVFLGEFVRGMHKWGSTVMIILIFLHMARTFFFGAYKYPRELNWVIGVVLLVLTLMMGLTGYLLPFDQRSFWATVVAVNINASGPVVGPYLADFLRPVRSSARPRSAASTRCTCWPCPA